MPRTAPDPRLRSDIAARHSARNDELAALIRDTLCPVESRALRTKLIEENLRIADAIASRYAGRGIPTEDLQQVARLALVRACDGYEPGPDRNFLAYAVPCMRGEIRRHFRDHGWMVRPPRRVQEAQYGVASRRTQLREELGHEPTPEELAAVLELDVETVKEALTLDGCFHPESLDRMVTLHDGGEGSVADRLAAPEDDFELAEARMMLAPLLASLPGRDVKVIELTYFEGLTQREVGEVIGVTQMQVSRILRRVLTHLRDCLEPVGNTRGQVAA